MAKPSTFPIVPLVAGRARKVSRLQNGPEKVDCRGLEAWPARTSHVQMLIPTRIVFFVTAFVKTRRDLQITLSPQPRRWRTDRKSTRLNSSHVEISYAVFCLKKKK